MALIVHKHRTSAPLYTAFTLYHVFHVLLAYSSLNQQKTTPDVSICLQVPIDNLMVKLHNFNYLLNGHIHRNLLDADDISITV